MAGSTYGNIFKISTWGESHGKALGVVIDGCPAGLPLCEEDIQLYLNRRKPGQNSLSTPRKEDDLVEIMLGRKHITFSIGSTTIIARILEGEFLNYKNAIPKTNSISTSVVTKELITSLERVSILINERIKNPVRCIFSDNSIQLLCTTPLGKSQDHCRLLEPSEKLEIGFNNRYLIDALKACPDAEVKLELNTHLSPIVMKPKDGDSYLYLILPVRLKADGE